MRMRMRMRRKPKRRNKPKHGEQRKKENKCRSIDRAGGLLLCTVDKSVMRLYERHALHAFNGQCDRRLCDAHNLILPKFICVDGMNSAGRRLATTINIYAKCKACIYVRTTYPLFCTNVDFFIKLVLPLLYTVPLTLT